MPDIARVKRFASLADITVEDELLQRRFAEIVPEIVQELVLRVSNSRASITLLGMSDAGKSTKGRCMREAFGLKVTEVDAKIAENPRMRNLVEGFPGTGVDRVAAAFGFPWKDPKRYRECEALYLEVEGEEMLRVVEEMTAAKADPVSFGVLMDATGSSIYRPEELRKALSLSLGVCLATDPNEIPGKLEQAEKRPKPWIWGPLLDKWDTAHAANPGQSISELPGLYRELLLDHRIPGYAKHADITVPVEDHRYESGKSWENLTHDERVAIARKVQRGIITQLRAVGEQLLAADC